MIQYAEYLESVFEASMDYDNDIPISSILYDGMSRMKYLKPSGRSWYTKMLADDMGKFYGDMGICSIARVYQIQRVLLGFFVAYVANGSKSNISVKCGKNFYFFVGNKGVRKWYIYRLPILLFIWWKQEP